MTDSVSGDGSSGNDQERLPRTVIWRRLWLRVHRWLGLTVGLLFVLLGLTGSLLVFDHCIDEWLNPDILLTQNTGERCSLEEVIASAKLAVGSERKRLVSVTRPRVENGVWNVWFSGRSNGQMQFTVVHVDPYTAVVTGQRIWGQDLMSWIYRLHFQLLGGSIGGAIVGFTGILIAFSLCSGLYLWWPLWMRSWRAAFAIRSGARFSYDLHKTVGASSAAILLVVVLTGVYMEFPMWIQSAVACFAQVTKEPENLKSTADGEGGSITADEALVIAQNRFPDATFDHFHPPRRSTRVYEVAMRQPGEFQSSYGRTQVFIDENTGSILWVRDPRNDTAADAFFAAQFPLHNGEAFGLAGRWVVFACGFAPAVLYVTGLILWWKKRNSRIRAMNRQ